EGAEAAQATGRHKAPDRQQGEWRRQRQARRPDRLPQPRAGKAHGVMVERRPMLARLSLGRTLRLLLLGLTLLLGTIAAIAIGNLYRARQHYEDKLARAYDLQVASSRLLADGAIEEDALGSRSLAARRSAAAAFDSDAQRALDLARGDAESERLVRARVATERRARQLAGRRGTARELANAVAE